ncbi:DUF3606 domain-containing protein [Tsuneonella sp. HG249]
MSDDTNNRGPQDRARVSGSQEHEVRYFAEQNGISMEQAEQLIERHGSSREELEEAVRQMKS